jgi:uncharacterized RDD family membrane protein YckC
MGPSGFPFQLLDEVLIAAAIVAATLLVIAPFAAHALIRWRAGRLPPHLGERFGEEWTAEVNAIDSRVRKLTFALAIAAMRTKTLREAEAEGADLALGGRRVVLSIEDVRVHSDFGNRFPAYLADFLIAFAIALMLGPLRPDDPYLSSLFGLATLTGTILLLQVFCVVRFGGSPGKLMMKLRIVPAESEALSVRHALLRVLPEYAFTVAAYAFTFYALSQIDRGSFVTLGSQQQAAAVLAALPWWLPGLLSYMRCGWALADVAVFFLSLERRALHDLIAGTVVILKVPHVVGALDVPSQSGSTLTR